MFKRANGVNGNIAVRHHMFSKMMHFHIDVLTTDHINEVIKWQQEAYFTSDPTSDQGQQPPKKPSVCFVSLDITILPPSTASLSSTTAPEVQPDEMPANKGELAANTHQETAQKQNSSIQEAPEPTNLLPPTTETSPPIIRRSTRSRRPLQRLIAQPTYASQFWDLWEIEDYEVQERMQNPIAFAVSADPDTMYHHEAMQQPDRAKFLEAMEAEVESHQSKGHWKV